MNETHNDENTRRRRRRRGGVDCKPNTQQSILLLVQNRLQIGGASIGLNLIIKMKKRRLKEEEERVDAHTHPAAPCESIRTADDTLMCRLLLLLTISSHVDEKKLKICR